MATSKTQVTVLSDTLTDGAGNTTSSAADVTTSHQAILDVKLANGGSSDLSVPAQVQIQLSEDNSEWYDYMRPLKGPEALSTTFSWGGIRIPAAANYVRVVAGSNVDDDVTCKVHLTKVTALS